MKKGFLQFLPLFLVFCTSSAFGQWTWLNPLPSGSTGRDITFVDGQTGFIINDTELLMTTDTGAHWDIKQPMVNAKQIRFKSEIGFIVGSYGVVYRSKDTGQSWSPIAVGSNENFNSVQILDKDTIYIVSETKLFKTWNGGGSWESVNIQANNIPTPHVVQAYFTSSRVGHAACLDGLILKTTDGGLSWYPTEQVHYFPSDFFTITFVNSQLGFASREFSEILKTTDGGETWKQMPNTTDGINSFFFLNDTLGYIAGEYGVIHKTTNGGQAWQWAGFLNGRYDASNLYGLYFLNENTGFAVGFRGRIMKTVDGGKVWQPYAFTYNDINEISLPSDSTGYIFSDRIYKTTDAGNTWVPMETGVDESQYYYPYGFFLTSEKGFATASGNYGDLKPLMTIDGGKTWTPSAVATNSISFISNDVGFAGGYGYGIYKTINGGDSWQLISDFSGRKVNFFDEARGFAILNGDLYRSVDGGVNWTKIYEVYGNFTDMDFVNDHVGFVSAEFGIVLKTADGGNAWEQLNTDYDHLLAISFADENIGFVSGEYGKNFSTSDGGNTWQNQYLPAQIRTLEALKSKKIFAGGLYGALLRSSLPFQDISLKALRADSITSTSAWLVGVVAANAGTVEDIRLEFGTAQSFAQNIALNPSAVQERKNSKYIYKVTGMKPGTPYQFRLRAIHNGIAVISNVISFTTLPALSLTMGYVFPKPHHADLNGSVVSNMDKITGITFQFDTTMQFTRSIAASPATVDANSNSYVQAPLDGLKSGMKYFVRLKATHQGKDYFSEPQNFLTPPEYTITFLYPSVSGSSVLVSAYVTSNELPISNLKFEYGTDRAYVTNIAGTPSSVNGFQTSYVSAVLESLLPDSVYYYRISGTLNGNSIYSGENLVRLSGGLILVTDRADSITATSAIFRGLMSLQGQIVYSVDFEYGLTSAYGQSSSIVNGISFFAPTVLLEAHVSNLTPDIYYHYRIRAFGNGQYTGKDQLFKTGTVTGVGESSTNELTLYPNPAGEAVVLSSGHVMEKVELLNAMGQPVFTTRPGATECTVTLASYCAGLYYVRINSNGNIVLMKLVKN